MSNQTLPPRFQKNTQATLNCPNCGKPMQLRDGKFGQFYGCTGYPNCKATVSIENAKQMIGESKTAKPKREFKPSIYQQAVFAFVSDGKGHAVVEAVAGSGKTTTIVKALELTPKGDKVLFCAFNKHIADHLSNELKQRGLIHVRASTLHSIGRTVLFEHLPNKPELDNDKLRNIVKEVLPLDTDYPLRAPLARLTSLAKATLVDPSDPIAVEEMAAKYGIELNGDAERLIQLLPKVLSMCLERSHVIDFDDMIWMPVALNLSLGTYDWVFVDECLPYHMPVLLADGTSKPIGEIVEQHLPAEVLAYNETTGKQQACKIVGWHRIYNQKPLVKIRVKHRGIVGNSNWPGHFIVCTKDHKIYANGNWMEAGKIEPGAVVQVETSAKKTQKYKITTRGRRKLSKIMTQKNKDGVCGTMRHAGGITVRGGNGREMPVPQQALLDALGEGWTAEYAIPTKMPRNSGYPTCYKADIANLQYKMVVEVDGSTHRDINRDDKKDSLLNALGWTVIHIPNLDAVKDTDHCVEFIMAECNNDCITEAVVQSVEPIDIPEYFVYDITVEGCHNFYANGILVHNCQDLSSCQGELVLRLVNGTGRIIGVGDRRQSIYGFMGADVNSIQRLIESLTATVLPLSITYRCPKSHVTLAKEIVPQIEAAPNAIDGVVRDVTYFRMMGEVQDGDLILCRVNAPLVKTCYSLIRRGVKAIIRGRDVGAQLQNMIDRLKPNDIYDLLEKIREYKWEQSEKLRRAGKEAQIESLVDRCDTLEALCDGIRDLSELRHRISSVFDDVTKTGVILSSVHRAKGDEAMRVYILKPELMPHPMATQGWQLEQEYNIMYVARTRSKNELIFVSGA